MFNIYEKIMYKNHYMSISLPLEFFFGEKKKFKTEIFLQKLITQEKKSYSRILNILTTKNNG